MSTKTCVDCGLTKDSTIIDDVRGAEGFQVHAKRRDSGLTGNDMLFDECRVCLGAKKYLGRLNAEIEAEKQRLINGLRNMANNLEGTEIIINSV